jgi:hypothetical protein
VGGFAYIIMIVSTLTVAGKTLFVRTLGRWH